MRCSKCGGEMREVEVTWCTCVGPPILPSGRPNYVYHRIHHRTMVLLCESCTFRDFPPRVPPGVHNNDRTE